MANVKISQLPSLSTMTDLAQIPVVSSGTTYQITGANLSNYFGGGGGVSIVPNDVTYTNGSLYGNANPGFTVEVTGDDDSAYDIPVDFPIEFLGNSYSSGNVWLVSNSYLTFGPDDYTDYHPVGPVTIPVPAIYIGSTDLSNQKYYYGYADGTDIFVIGFEGSIETGGETNFPAIQWELQVNSATPDQIKIVVAGPANNGGSLNFPAGVWGISNGAEWIDQFQPLPWYSNTNDNTYNAITIAPVTPVAANTIAFTGPGVTYSENGGTTYINIDPFDQAISVGYNDDSSEAIISSVYYGLTITTATDGEQLTLAPLGDVNISAGSASNNQPGDGYQVNIYGGNAHDDPNSPGSNYDGGTVNITGGNPVGNTGVPGAVRLTANGNTWTFNGKGQVIFPTLTVNLHNGGNQSGQVLQFGDPAQQAIITGPTPTANVNSQRLIIQGQRGNGTGEGGDVYLWAGDADTNGGDIKIYAGDADNVSVGYGGYINIDGGAGYTRGGQVEITGGYSSSGDGGYANLLGGGGSTQGGNVGVQAGYGQAGPGGAVTIQGGGSANGLAEYGNVNISAGATTWTFDNTGNLTIGHGSKILEVASPVPGNYALSLSGTGAISPDQQLLIYPTSLDANHLHLTSGNLYNTELFLGNDNLYVKLANTGDVVINSDDSVGNTAQWTFAADGSTTFPTGNITSNTSLQLTTTFGNYRTVEYQTAGVWDAYVEDVATGPNNAWSWIDITFKDNFINKPQVFIENQKASDGIALRWTFDENGYLNFPRDAVGNTDPILSIVGGANPGITSTDASLAGPANLNIVSNFAVFSGFNGNTVSIYADDGEIAGSNNIQIWTNAGNVTEYSWTFGADGTLTAPGQITAPSLITNSIRSDDSSFVNIEDGVNITGAIVASGNISGAYILGNGSQLTSLPAPAVTQDITSNGAMSIMTYDGVIKYVNYATVEPSSGNITGGNLLTSGLISATGNITAGNVNTNTLVGTATTIKSTGALNLSATGNIVVNSTYINNLSNPVLDQDAATKYYVDTVAQGLNIHQAANLASTQDLATYTGATVTYSNGTSGVGATLSLVGNTLTTLDGTAIPASADTRLLIKNQANAVLNGVYNYTSSSLLTRSTDMDDTTGLAGGDFLFVTSGATQADTGWIQTTDTVVVGTDNVVFAQFSSAGAYTANTSAGLALDGSIFSAKTDGITTAFDGGGNIIVKASANLTTPNIGAATGTSLSTTGNITGGNILGGANVNATTHTGTTVSVSANITGGNLLTSGLISATGNITGGNISATNIAGSLTTAAQGNITSVGTLNGVTVSGTALADTFRGRTGSDLPIQGVGNANILIQPAGTGITDFYNRPIANISTASVIGNITGGNILGGANVNATTHTGTTVSVTGNITGGNILGGANVNATTHTGTTVSVTGNITGGNVLGGANVNATTHTGTTVSVSANITGGNVTTAGLTSTASLSITGNTATVTSANYSIGYLNIPQVSLSANSTAALTDSGKHFYSTTAGNLEITIPDNANVAFPVGTAISIVVQAAGNVLVVTQPSATLYLGGNATSGNRVVGTYGMATIMKVATDTWFISGTGVS